MEHKQGHQHWLQHFSPAPVCDLAAHCRRLANKAIRPPSVQIPSARANLIVSLSWVSSFSTLKPAVMDLPKVIRPPVASPDLFKGLLLEFGLHSLTVIV